MARGLGGLCLVAFAACAAPRQPVGAGAIDRIAYCPRSELVDGLWLVDQKFDGHWPSDHYPIVADFRLTST